MTEMKGGEIQWQDQQDVEEYVWNQLMIVFFQMDF